MVGLKGWREGTSRDWDWMWWREGFRLSVRFFSNLQFSSQALEAAQLAKPRATAARLFRHHQRLIRHVSTSCLHMFLVDWFFGALGYLGKVFFIKPVSPTCTTTIVAFRPSTGCLPPISTRAQKIFLNALRLFFHFQMTNHWLFSSSTMTLLPPCFAPPAPTAPPQVFTTRMHVFCSSG